jgi:hypothetical protein
MSQDVELALSPWSDDIGKMRRIALVETINKYEIPNLMSDSSVIWATKMN